MLTVVRHILAIAVLPFVVTVVIPTWIARGNGTVPSVGTTPLQVLTQLGGVGLLVIGLTLFVASLQRFATEGQGTLAPWDPPRKLVVRGPYRYVRNPMISGVIFILFAEAALLRSVPHAQWALLFLGLNLVQIPFFEEPQLRLRFGAAYDEYCRNVPRVFPRIRPWKG